jgi:DNA mismatch endonuclease (patch repair protein)
MRANPGRDTKPELKLRSALHRRGLRFRKNLRIDLGSRRRVRPDIAFTKLKLAVFVDGCFWHGCEQHRSIPVSNRSFWRAKIEGTRLRDQQQVQWLEDAGWTAIRIWEHDVPEPAEQIVATAANELRARNIG